MTMPAPDQDQAPDPEVTSIPDVDIYEGGSEEPEEAPEVEAAPEDVEDSEDDSGAADEPEGGDSEEAEAAPVNGDGAQELPAHVKAAMDDVLRRERELVEQRHQARQQAEAADRLAKLQELARQDPIRALREMGGDTQTALEKALGIEPEEDELEKAPAVRKLYDRIAQLEQETQKAQQQTRQQQIADAQRKIYQGYATVAQGAGEESILSAFGDQLAPDTMFALAEQFAQQTGKWPKDEEVARHAEELLMKQAEELLGRLAKTPRFRDRFASNGASHEQTAGQDTPTPGTKALRNRNTAEPPRRKKERDLTSAEPEEVLAAGLAAFQAIDKRK